MWEPNFKGYLYYKMITSQDVSCETQVIVFYFIEKLYSVMKIFKFLYF